MVLKADTSEIKTYCDLQPCVRTMVRVSRLWGKKVWTTKTGAGMTFGRETKTHVLRNATRTGRTARNQKLSASSHLQLVTSDVGAAI